MVSHEHRGGLGEDKIYIDIVVLSIYMGVTKVVLCCLEDFL
jgi:hypothetical protein